MSRQPLERDQRGRRYGGSHALEASSPEGCVDVLILMDAARDETPTQEICLARKHAAGCPLCGRRLRSYRDLLATPDE